MASVHNRTEHWSGGLWFSGGRALYVGPAFNTEVHAHHAVQVCLALHGRMRLRSGPGAKWASRTAAVIPSDVPHQLDGCGSTVALLYLDPESDTAGNLLQGYISAGIAPLPQRMARGFSQARRMMEHCIPEKSDDLLEAVVRALVPGGSAPRTREPRLARALTLLRAAPDHRVAVVEVARAAGLSASRLAHLFRAQTGLPIRRDCLWLRLGDGLRELARGVSATEAAHAAGFADSAHFTRTCRRMLGITPSLLRRV